MRIRRNIPNTGMYFSSTDLYVGELFAHAQSCIWLLGYSDMADLLLAGKDPHGDGGAAVMGITYEEFMHRLKVLKDIVAKAMRQGFKPFSFGKPAGMGDVKIVQSNRKQGPDTPCPNGPVWIIDSNKRVRGYKGTRFCILVDGAARCGFNPDGTSNMVTQWGRREEAISPTCGHCLEVSRRLSTAWRTKAREHQTYGTLIGDFVENGMVIQPEALERWPHLQPYFAPNTQLDPGQIMQHVSGRIRGGLNYSECSNTFFQGLIGDITKAAFFRVLMESKDRTMRVPDRRYANSRRSRYAGQRSPLAYGCQPIGFFHDEVFAEHPPDISHDCAMRIQEILEEEMAHFMPDLAPAVRAEACLMEGSWDKRAEPLWRDGGAKGRKGDSDILVPWVAPEAKLVT